MGIRAEAKIFYGVCLADEEDDCDFDEDEEVDEDEGPLTLIRQIQNKFPDFEGYSTGVEAIPGASELLAMDITGYDGGLRDYLILKSTEQNCSPGEGEVILDSLAEQDDQPFREFFEIVGLPYVQPKWHMGCLYF